MNNGWITSGASIIILALAMWLGLLGKPTEMGLIIIAGSISIAFLNIDRIQRFKGAGFEAEMRQAVEEAHATLDQLRNLAVASTESSLTTLMAGSFMSGISSEKRLDVHDRLIQTLKELGVKRSEIDKAEHLWKKGVGVIYHRGIGKNLAQQDDPVLNNSAIVSIVREASKQLQDLLQFETWTAPSSIEIQRLIEKNNLMTPELEKLITDYSDFEKTGKISRREVFVLL